MPYYVAAGAALANTTERVPGTTEMAFLIVLQARSAASGGKQGSFSRHLPPSGGLADGHLRALVRPFLHVHGSLMPVCVSRSPLLIGTTVMLDWGQLM